MNQLVVMGSINLDHLLAVNAFPRPGETVAINQYQTVAGGKGANQAVAAARQGGAPSFIACVGNDMAGGEMLTALELEGIDTSGITQLKDETTGMAVIYVDGQGENNIGIWPGANATLSAQSVIPHQQTIATADILLLQLETPLDGIEKALQLAQEHATKVVLNPAPATRLSADLLSCVDIITPNETEAELLTGIRVTTLEDAAKAAERLHQSGIATVIITLGKQGVWLSQRGNGSHHPGFTVDALDSTAAGDTFNGALIAELSNGAELDTAIRYAQAAAALSVTRLGAQPSIPHRKQVLQFLAAQQ